MCLRSWLPSEPNAVRRRTELSVRCFQFLSFLLFLLASIAVQAGLLGEVRLLDGNRYKGELKLKGGVFELTHGEDTVTTIAPESLKYLLCRGASDAEVKARKAGGNGLLGVYYDGLDFKGNRIQRIDSTVDFRIGDRAPISGLKKDGFSVRWTGEVMAAENGRHEFSILTDDGGRLWVGGQLLVDQWRDQSETSGNGSIDLEKGKKYALKFEYYERSGDCTARLMWKVPFQGMTVIPESHLFARDPVRSGDSQLGLLGRYYKNPDLSGSPHSRIDNDVNFDWQEASPFPGFNNDNFSVRWTGLVEGPSTGKYIFYIVTNDGGRLWIDGKLVVDQWRSQSATEGRGEIDLVAGRLYSLRMEHFQNAGTAVAKLLWEGPNVRKEVVPYSRLHTGVAKDQALPDNGLLGQYFRGMELGGSPKYRHDPRVDFRWERAPMSGLSRDQFSVRWQGNLTVPATGDYTFHLDADDGVRLWIDHDMVIDSWKSSRGDLKSEPIELREGEEYAIRLDYFEDDSEARVRLMWSSPEMARTMIPSKAFTPSTEAEARRTMQLTRRRVPEGVMMSDGTVVARRVKTADLTSVKFSSSNDPVLSTSGVSWILFDSVPPEMLAAFSAGRPGVILRNGDFIDGEFKGIEGSRIRISSVLFGIRSFDRGRVNGVVLRAAKPVEGRFEVRTHRGSVFVVDEFEVNKEGVLFDTPVLGGLKIHPWELQTVRRLK